VVYGVNKRWRRGCGAATDLNDWTYESVQTGGVKRELFGDASPVRSRLIRSDGRRNAACSCDRAGRLGLEMNGDWVSASSAKSFWMYNAATHQQSAPFGKELPGKTGYIESSFDSHGGIAVYRVSTDLDDSALFYSNPLDPKKHVALPSGQHPRMCGDDLYGVSTRSGRALLIMQFDPATGAAMRRVGAVPFTRASAIAGCNANSLYVSRDDTRTVRITAIPLH